MNLQAALGVDDVEKEYAFAKGIVEGIPVENVNCEGCVLFGNVECSRLCALTHRVVTWLREERNNLVTMFATRNEVYSEFVSEVLDNFSERY